MTGRLAGKAAFITGAARGQGRAHAVRMAEEGADIIAVDLAMATAADIRDFDALRTAVDEGVEAYGRLDVIVANAGICTPAPWNEITPESFRDIIDVNVTGTWNTVMAGAHESSTVVGAVRSS